MASPNSPYTPEIAEEWEAILKARDKGVSLEELMSRWRSFHDANRNGGEWKVPLDDATLVASLGNDLAMASGDYALARDLAAEMLAHPDFGWHPRNEVDIVYFWIRLAIADVLCGDIERGVAGMLRPYQHEPIPSSKYSAMLRADLINLLYTLGAENVADPRIAAVVSEVVGQFPRCKTKSRLAMRGKKNGDLEELLRQTYPRPKRS